MIDGFVSENVRFEKGGFGKEVVSELFGNSWSL